MLSPIIASLIKLAISRRREFLADASGALLTRYPEGLAKALEKIATYNQPMKNAHTATAHLFIANPFGSKASIGNLFATHPPVEKRITALRSM
jgi:heat shock protein HtpX